MENEENREDGDAVVTPSRCILNDGGNDQARDEVRGVGINNDHYTDNGENSTSVRREEIIYNGGDGGDSRQRNGDGDTANREEGSFRRRRSFSEDDVRDGSTVRPPPLNLTSSNVNLPGLPEEEGHDTTISLTDIDCNYSVSSEKLSIAEGSNSRGAYVDVNVFRYQPGVVGPPENLKNYRISVRGGALLGGMMEGVLNQPNSFALTGTMDIASEYERRKGMHVIRHHIKDHRAKQLLVVPSDDKFVALAAPEAFSRHSGTCMILGGQGAYAPGPSRSYELKLGHFLRIGSVGVVVSEIHTGITKEHKCLTWEELTCLKGDIAAIQKDLVTTEALTAREERCQTIERSQRAKQQAYCSAKPDGHNGDAEDSADEDNNSISSCTSSATVPVDHMLYHTSGDGLVGDSSSSHLRVGKMCYMCFDDIDSEDNPLVAPCQCLGDTRYVHINCLQTWHTTAAENKVCVVLNNKGVRICTVCKTPYKASVRLPDGEVVALFQSPLPPPYICFMVVTKHLNNEDLFSTKYQLSFSSLVNRAGTGALRPLLIGRSRSCDMVLDYRTVSTKHAEVKFSNGRFYFTDMMSSNGSYLYVREPLMLPYGETVYLKWGSNVVSMKAKRSIRHRLSTLVGRRSLSSAGKGKNDNGMSILESLCDQPITN